MGNKTLLDVVLVWRGMTTPIVLALGVTPSMPQLVQGILDKLPDHFFCLYQKPLEPLFRSSYRRISHLYGRKMDFQGLRPDLRESTNAQCVQLTPSDEPALQQLLHVANPRAFFNPQMLATGKFYGVKNGKDIISVAGIHVYSPRYRIATLGNITTHPSMRRRGLATQCMVTLLKALEPDVDFIGLNTRADNTPAITCYQRIGFTIASTYEGAYFDKFAS
jgi:ribosomal protein S18 acetylase RimI-like enzyme